ncbi:hypothetical protein DDZ16_12795 [Marinilabilia rubra]|uniref:DUF4832 domain-containing protein n=2 Tax=Marinilabilia rubra TaxID=2162893 RepID=A0A2U2B758_9BACT|nr:hypothetical protein DDZ16_12795 [Marinilabilia rubra]
MTNSSFLPVFLSVILLFCACSRSKGTKEPKGVKNEVTFEPDLESLIRNPGMGWVIYDDANDEVADATDYWNKQDEIARNYASCLYIRWRWSDLEPEEGRYAWIYDDNFKALVQGALDRGLKLAFRVYVNGQDNIKPGTPQFVFDAGAASYEVEKLGGGKNKTPYPDDPVFQEKFENFIKAFALEFDNTSKVDFIDGFNLGWWGEGHHLKFQNPLNKQSVFSWIINLYGSAFENVPLALTVNSEVGYELEKLVAFEGQDYILRRDGLGSQWFSDYEKGIVKGNFPEKMFIAEAAYWGNGSIEYYSDIDKRHDWTTWNMYYTQVVDEALEHHANYLDLREALESERYVTQALGQVERFIRWGGYRIYPSEISYEKQLTQELKLKINHTWRNIGVGVMPNNNLRWNFKYKVCFGFVDDKGEQVKVHYSKEAEPSDWIKGKDFSYEETIDISDLPTGKYQLVVAIVNSIMNDVGEISLAIQDQSLFSENKWLKVGSVEKK